MKEQLAARAILEDEIELARRLEGVRHLHDERVRHLLQNLAFGLRVLDLIALDDLRDTGES